MPCWVELSANCVAPILSIGVSMLSNTPLRAEMVTGMVIFMQVFAVAAPARSAIAAVPVEIRMLKQAKKQNKRRWVSTRSTEVWGG